MVGETSDRQLRTPVNGNGWTIFEKISFSSINCGWDLVRWTLKLDEPLLSESEHSASSLEKIMSKSMPPYPEFWHDLSPLNLYMAPSPPEFRHGPSPHESRLPWIWTLTPSFAESRLDPSFPEPRHGPFILKHGPLLWIWIWPPLPLNLDMSPSFRWIERWTTDSLNLVKYLLSLASI